MRVAIITDLHWGVRNNAQFFLDHQEDFYYNFFLPYLEKEGITSVWMLGDFFENRKLISTKILNKVDSFLKELERRGLECVFLIGNHDVAYKNTNVVNSLTPTTRAFKNIRVIDEFEVIDFDGLSVGFISWISPEIRERSEKWIQTVNARVLCGHFEINSFEVVKGVVCSKGFCPEMFDRFDKVFSGHFHIRATNGIVQYIGNPFQTNWGEYGYPKGFAVFDTKTLDLTFVDNPKTAYEILKYSDDVAIEDLDFSQYDNKILRLMVSDCKDRKKLETITDYLNSRAHYVEVIEDKDVVVGPSLEVVPTDTIHLISQYLDSCKIGGHINRKQLDDIVLDIYQESLERGVLEC